MNLSHYITSDYEDKSGPLTIKKQSQNKPNQSQPVVSKPVLPVRHSFSDGGSTVEPFIVSLPGK
jgi:hypothetical protein